MFQGQVDDAAAARAALDKWVDELAPEAEGWLGSTGGVTDDGMLVASARFESEAAARRNSDRMEQGQWWGQMAALFSGDVLFSNSTHVTENIHGDPGAAGFVQVMQGQGTDPERARELMAQDREAWAELRPEGLGSLVVEHEGGRFTMIMYFTSEEAAREGEAKQVPPELTGRMDELNSLLVGQPTFYDLKDPWLAAPA